MEEEKAVRYKVEVERLLPVRGSVPVLCSLCDRNVP